jgi:hypothetical protein
MQRGHGFGSEDDRRRAAADARRMRRAAAREPVPTSVTALRSHPVYCLERLCQRGKRLEGALKAISWSLGIAAAGLYAPIHSLLGRNLLPRKVG